MNRATRNACGDDRAAQLVEFAVSLPLLVLFVVGIFDFSSAFTLKQKLTNIARDAARTAAADPATDLQTPSNPLPASVVDAFLDIDGYLKANKIDDCGVGIGSASRTAMTWTFTGTTNCPTAGLTIVINRGYYFSAAAASQAINPSCQTQPLTGGPTQVAIIATCVSIQYPYQWRFGRVAGILNSRINLPNAIVATAVAMNEN